ncbi:MAG: hypothetical protein QOD07_1236 [Frankiaceae bacterium]|jgi:hypothetical protein|nr:hypothetical protein [Frankiaceae bacterium]
MGLRRTATVLLTVAVTSASFATTAAQAAKHPDGVSIHAGGPHGQVVAHQAHTTAGARRGGSPNMTSHGGGIMVTSDVTPIFWGKAWANSAFTGDKKTGIATFYGGYHGSNYAKASDEYIGNNGQVGPSLTLRGSLTDTSSSLTKTPSTTTILGEVAKEISNPVANGYYPVYTDLPRGNAGYCAWHSWGTIGSVPVQFAFFFALDGDAGCDPGDNSGLHSQGLAALANVSAHELSEARTDPRGDGWFDSSGAENGDKCAWTFNVPLVSFSNGSQWMVQGEWSNAAYNGGTGYANSSGQKGCVDGH